MAVIKMNLKRIHRSYLIAAVVFMSTAIIALLIWYHTPFEKHITIIVENQTDLGNYKELSLDLIIERHFIFVTEMRGQLQFDDRLYKSLKTEEINVFQRIWRKISGGVEIPILWVNSENIGSIGLENPVDISPERMLSDLIYVQDLRFDNEYMIEIISLLRTSDGASIWSSR
jgi:hypothetical protein